MTQDDLNQIDELFQKRLDEKLSASEQRLKEEISVSEKRIMNDIGDFVDRSLLPQIVEKADKMDIDRLERKMDRVLDNDLEQDSRLTNIESIPVIAHELKLKKSE